MTIDATAASLEDDPHRALAAALLAVALQVLDGEHHDGVVLPCGRDARAAVAGRPGGRSGRPRAYDR